MFATQWPGHMFSELASLPNLIVEIDSDNLSGLDHHIPDTPQQIARRLATARYSNLRG